MSADPDTAPRRLRAWPLAVVAGVVMLLAVSGVLPAWAGLLQSVALPPLDLVADIRALLVYMPWWPVSVVALVAVVVVRAAVLALLLGGLTRQRFLFALRFYLVVLPFAAVAAAATYASQALLFYGLFWIGLFVALLLLVLTGGVPWLAPPRLRSGFAAATASGFRAGTLGAYGALLIVLGWVADVGGTVVAVLAVPVSAALTWLAAQSLYADPGFQIARRALAVLPLAAVVGLVTVALTGPTMPPRAPYPEDPRPGSLLLMSGIDSSSGSGAMLEIDPNALRYTCDQTFYFSYAGPGAGQPQNDAVCAIDHGTEYQPIDTMRSRDEVIPFLDAFATDMPAPGAALGHSQGAWLVWEAAVEGGLPGVEAVVLVGPFVANPVAYPATGEGGQGATGRLLLGAFANVARPGGTTVFEPDSPLGREWLGHPDAIQRTLARPLPPEVQALTVPSVFDLPLMPGDPEVDGAEAACPVPVMHPDLPYSGEFHEAVVRFLDGEQQGECPAWREAVGPALRVFTAPPAAAPPGG